MSVHNDLPTTLVDKLGWRVEVSRVSAKIAQCRTPHVFGIHGDWGSGKTSFMRQLQYKLGGNIPEDGSTDIIDTPASAVQKTNKRVVTIWIDAWRYQNEPVPIVALLHEMRRQMTLIPAVCNKAKKLVRLHYERCGTVCPTLAML